MRFVRRGICMSNVTSKRTCEASEKVKLSTLEVAGEPVPRHGMSTPLSPPPFGFFFFFGSPLSKSHVKVREKGQNFPGSSRVEPHQQIQHLWRPRDLITQKCTFLFAKLESKTCPKQLNSDTSGRAYLQLCLQGKIKPHFIHPSRVTGVLNPISGIMIWRPWVITGFCFFFIIQGQIYFSSTIIKWIFNKGRSDTIMNKLVRTDNRKENP